MSVVTESLNRLLRVRALQRALGVPTSQSGWRLDLMITELQRFELQLLLVQLDHLLRPLGGRQPGARA